MNTLFFYYQIIIHQLIYICLEIPNVLIFVFIFKILIDIIDDTPNSIKLLLLSLILITF